ncbi:MAG: exo-beta-N-acetylmuramidase NamZ domain-containing protein, partial [Planctomycetota bacterium]
EHLTHIDALVAKGLDEKQMPGCVIAIGHKGKLVFLKAYGKRSLYPTAEPMQVDTVFDLASITKPVATATSVMVLLEQGKIRLRDRVSDLIPEFGVNGKKRITVEQLLTHQGGLIPDNALKDYRDGREKAFERIYGLSTFVEPGSRFVYSDVGFLVLADLVQRVSGQDVHEFSQEHIFDPLGMNDTGFTPREGLRARAAVTEKRDGRWLQGVVHDPRAHELGGIAGHAGLFSTANDLAVYAQMLLQGGSYRGKRILSSRSTELMTAAYPVSSGTRGLGWDKRTGYSSNRGETLTNKAFGHGGFTGTVLWVDPGLDLFYLFLSHRVHPNGSGAINDLAGRIGTIAASAIRSDEDLQGTQRDGARESKARQATATCELGLDVIQRDGFKVLSGKRVGLITNHTAVDSTGQWIVPLLHQATEVDLRALFSPEHGMLGKLDMPDIADSTDPKTGLVVHSLYGETRQPTSEQLEDLDCLIFDIQDIGTRFYTYISTMGLAMKAADKRGLEFIVLDRPNPIGGHVVDGPMIDDDKLSFVGFHSMPVRHGMTVGELARMFQSELELDRLTLTVVPVKDWQRDQWFDDTGLWWINPSPNMRSLQQALIYPGVGLLETTNLSVGRGTDTPFEILGAPWIEARSFAAKLNARKLPGVKFVPRRFTPDASRFANELCQGVEILITNRELFQSIDTGLTIATLLRADYSEEWEVDRFNRLLGNQAMFDAVKQGETLGRVIDTFRSPLESFRKRREPFLLYSSSSRK